MKRNQFLLAKTTIFAFVILLVAVLTLVNSDVNLVRAQMMTEPPTSSPTSTNDMTILIVLVAIAIVAIVVIAIVVLYLVISRNKKKETARESQHVYASQTKGTALLQPQKDAVKEQAKPFQVFLCYKKSSGKDYADHLKLGLEEIGFHTFEDCKDIPLTVETEEGWSAIRNQALAESKFFILIMTPGFDLSSEVISEIAMARKQANKTFIFFRHRSMGRKIIINLGQ